MLLWEVARAGAGAGAASAGRAEAKLAPRTAERAKGTRGFDMSFLR